jgi:hypothetical protein
VCKVELGSFHVPDLFMGPLLEAATVDARQMHEHCTRALDAACGSASAADRSLPSPGSAASAGAFRQFQHALLYAEEVQWKIDIGAYDMHGVVMQVTKNHSKGRFTLQHKLDIPGLAENRPALCRCLPAHCRSQRTAPHEPRCTDCVCTRASQRRRHHLRHPGGRAARAAVDGDRLLQKRGGRTSVAARRVPGRAAVRRALRLLSRAAARAPPETNPCTHDAPLHAHPRPSRVSGRARAMLGGARR